MSETTGELKVLLGVLQEDVKEIKQTSKESLVQATKTNGRVNRHDDEFVHLHQTLLMLIENDKKNAGAIEKEKMWRSRIIGGLVTMNIFMVPPMLYIITKLIDRLFH